MSRHQLAVLIQVLLLAITIGCFIAAMNGVYVARELAETTPAGLDGEVGARVDRAFSYMQIAARSTPVTIPPPIVGTASTNECTDSPICSRRFAPWRIYLSMSRSSANGSPVAAN